MIILRTMIIDVHVLYLRFLESWFFLLELKGSELLSELGYDLLESVNTFLVDFFLLSLLFDLFCQVHIVYFLLCEIIFQYLSLTRRRNRNRINLLSLSLSLSLSLLIFISRFIHLTFIFNFRKSFSLIFNTT